MAQQRKRINNAADGTSYEYRCHENVDLDDLDPQVLLRTCSSHRGKRQRGSILECRSRTATRAGSTTGTT